MHLLGIPNTKPPTKFEVSSSSSFGDMFDRISKIVGSRDLGHVRILIGLLTGHADLNRHLTLMKSGRILLVPSVKRKKKLLSISLEDAAHCQLLDLLF